MARAYRSKRKATNKPRRYRKRGAKGKGLGGFRINRRIPAMAITPSQLVAGNINSTNLTVLKLGTPVASQTFALNYYDVPFSMEFKLSDVDTYSDIVNISDKYRIAGASVNFITNPGSYFGGAALPYLQIVPDFDDSVPPTLSVLNQKMGLKTRTFNAIGMTKLRFKPVPVTTLLNGTGSNIAASSPGRSPFINCSAPDVPHFGIKGVMRNIYCPGTSAAVQNIAVDITLNIQCRDLQ